MKRVINIALVVLFVAAIVCGWRLYNNYRDDAVANTAVDDLLTMKPGSDDADSVPVDFTSLRTANSDIIAWLTIPDTAIDYPVMQAADNQYYLHYDVDKKENKNGAPFLDYRAHADFSDFNNVIYGHHMRSGRMFQNLVKFKEKAFFDSHTAGTLYTPNQTWRLGIFAVAVTPEHSAWYDNTLFSIAKKEAHLQMMQKTAMYYRDIGVTADDRIVLLSTCSYEYNGARLVVAARLMKI